MGRRILLTAAFLAVGACSPPAATIVDLAPPASGPAATTIVQDVDFLRGCWIERDNYGFATAMLRLLPPEGPNSPNLDGQLQHFSRAEIVRSRHYVVSRDGRTLWNNDAWDSAAPPPDAPTILSPSARRAVFSRLTTQWAKQIYIGETHDWRPAEPEREWFIAESNGDRLALYRLRYDGIATSEFDGRRDGCD